MSEIGIPRWSGDGGGGGEDDPLQSPDKSVGRRVVSLGFGGGGDE